MLSRDDVMQGYRFILGREPESEAAIASQQQNHASLADFRAALLKSAEFRGLAPQIFGADTDALSIRFHGSSGGSLLAVLLENAFKKALALESRLPLEILSMPGMSGRKYRRFINNLVGSIPNPRYLEIGSWAGSTACAAMYGNQAGITCVDDWSQFGGPREAFFDNINKYRNERTEFDFIEANFRDIDFANLGKYNIYLFDGPHSYQDQFDGAIAALAALDSEYVFIVDDWNWPEPRAGSLSALRSRGLYPVYAIEIRTTQDGTHPLVQMQNSDWHNGYYMAVIHRDGL
jgi:hypothetical protein